MVSEKPILRRCEGNEWLHIYAQPFNHAEARIVGTREGLTSLRDAINSALDGDHTLYGALVADGEGYWIEVEVSTEEKMRGMPLPYTDYYPNASTVNVWIGFSDGKPHVFDCELDGRNIAAYTSRAEARKHYQDVRRARLVIEPKPRRRE